MPNYLSTISGSFVLAAPLANGATLSIGFPQSSRVDWSTVDVQTVRLGLSSQDVLGYPAISITVTTTLNITNNSGVTLPAGRAVISGRVPEITPRRIEQANYDALATPVRNDLYLIPEA